MFQFVLVGLLTLGYWAWEYQATGDMRNELFLIYPALFVAYVWLLWQKMKWLAVGVAAGLMAANWGVHFSGLLDRF